MAFAGVVAPAPKVSVPSALASSNVADDSWFAPHEARAAVAYAPVCDGGAYRAYCDEYNAKFEVYQRLHQEMSAVKRCAPGPLCMQSVQAKSSGTCDIAAYGCFQMCSLRSVAGWDTNISVLQTDICTELKWCQAEALRRRLGLREACLLRCTLPAEGAPGWVSRIWQCDKLAYWPQPHDVVVVLCSGQIRGGAQGGGPYGGVRRAPAGVRRPGKAAVSAHADAHAALEPRLPGAHSSCRALSMSAEESPQTMHARQPHCLGYVTPGGASVLLQVGKLKFLL